MENMTLVSAMAIGVSQALALIPGTSRSGITMSAARLLGLERAEAARFSFLLGIPAIAGAGALTMADFAASGEGIPADVLWAAFLTFFSALAAIALLMAVVRRTSFLIFVLYRLALGLFLFALIYEWIPGVTVSLQIFRVVANRQQSGSNTHLNKVRKVFSGKPSSSRVPKMVPKYPFLAGALIGASLGAMIAVQLPQNLLQIILAVFILFILWISLPTIEELNPMVIGVGGVATTFLTMFVGATGPLTALLFERLFSDRRDFIATNATAMTFQHGFKIIAFGLARFCLV